MMAFIINAFAPDSIITSITRHIHWAISSGFLCEIFWLKNLHDFNNATLAQLDSTLLNSAQLWLNQMSWPNISTQMTIKKYVWYTRHIFMCGIDE